MIGEPKCDLDDGECRIGVPAGRKHAATPDEKIIQTEDFAVRIDNAAFGRRGHAGRSHMMTPRRFFPLPQAWHRQVRIEHPIGQSQPSEIGLYQEATEFHRIFPDGSPIEITDPPIENWPPLAETIPIRAQRHPARRIRRLFPRRSENDSIDFGQVTGTQSATYPIVEACEYLQFLLHFKNNIRSKKTRLHPKSTIHYTFTFYKIFCWRQVRITIKILQVSSPTGPLPGKNRDANIHMVVFHKETPQQIMLVSDACFNLVVAVQ